MFVFPDFDCISLQLSCSSLSFWCLTEHSASALSDKAIFVWKTTTNEVFNKTLIWANFFDLNSHTQSFFHRSDATWSCIWHLFYKWHNKTFPSAIFASRWTFEVLESHPHSWSILRKLHLHSMATAHQATRLCLHSKLYCFLAVVTNENVYLLNYSNNSCGKRTGVNLARSSFKKLKGSLIMRR